MGCQLVWSLLKKLNMSFVARFTVHLSSLGHQNIQTNEVPWFKFYFPLFFGVVLYDNEFETMKNKI